MRLPDCHRTYRKDMERRKQYYDRKAHCMDIVVGVIVLVRQKVFRTTYKIEDKWEVPVYIVLEKPTTME